MGSQIVTQVEATRVAGDLGGVRGAFRTTGQSHAKDYPEQMREHLAPHVKAYCDMLAQGALKGDRTCVRIFSDLMGDLGSKGDLIRALVISVGAASPEHLKAAASSALDAEAIDEPTAYAQALDFVHQYRREHGLPALVEVPVEDAGEVPGA